MTNSIKFSEFVTIISKLIKSEYPKLSKENREKLTTHFRMAYLDAHFIRVRNREGFFFDDQPNQSIELPNEWTLEEKCFLMKTKELLYDKDKKASYPITPNLAIYIQIIFGRDDVQFDPTFPQVYPMMITQAIHPQKDIQIPQFHPSDFGTIYYNPSLIYNYLEDLISMPNAVCKFINHKKQPNDETIISNVNEINKIMGTKLKKRPFTFHCAYSIPITIEIFPCGKNGSWYRINSGYFTMAFGNDLSNGNGIKYPWVNTYSGVCPYTLSDNGQEPPVQWIPADDDYVTNALNQDILHFECPDFHPDTYIEHAYAALDDAEDKDAKHTRLFWIDKKLQRISDDDIKAILNNEDGKDFFIVQCSMNAECGGKCPRCIVRNNGPLKDLGVFYSGKQWGVVALKDIPSGTYITDYAGEISPGAFRDEDLELGFQFEFGIDSTDNSVKANKKTNIGRFINQSCYPDLKKVDDEFTQPNAVPLFIISLNKTVFRVGYFATRYIYAGEEINVNYGSKYKNHYKCLCNVCLKNKSQTT